MTRPAGRVRPYAPVLLEFIRLADAAVLGATMWITVWLLGGSMANLYALAAILSMASFGLLASSLNSYRSFRSLRLSHELGRLYVAWTVAMVPTAAVVVLHNQHALPDNIFAVWFLIGIAYITFSRSLARAFLRLARVSGLNFRTVAVVGATPIAAELALELSVSPWMGLRSAGIFDDREAGTRTESVSLAGNTRDLVALARAGEIDLIYIALPLRAEMRIAELTRALADTTATIQFVPDVSEFGPLHARFDLVGSIPTISIVETPFRGRAAVMKRVTDLVVGASALLVLSPVLISIALAIKATSSGPIFFRQPRYGLDGRTFMIWKFRSMSIQPAARDAAQAVRNDPRVTPLGAILRRYSLDELPQLINVLNGTMSIIGPRPHPINMNEVERLRINRYMQRHIVKPGITGLAQVNGYRGETDTTEKVEKRIQYDLDYIEGWSIWLDMRILWRTVKGIWNDPNAY